MTNTDTSTTPITDQLTATIDSHLEAYAMADAGRRDRLVAETWNADGELIDPPLQGRGRSEISALADVVLTHYADHRFVRTTAVDAHNGFARYGWELKAPDGNVAVNGIDIAQFDDSGKLLRIVGFFGPMEPVSR